MTNEGRIIHILWTGGMDSTFRIVELSRCRCTIQPYYIMMGKRKSYPYELEAIGKISQILKRDKRTQAKLLAPKIVNEQDIPRDSVTFDSWCRLMKAKSWQYYILAKYVNLYHIEMEMGLQFSPNGSVVRAVDETLLIPYPNQNYDVLMIDKTKADQDTLNVFGGFCFPKSLYHKTKKEEVEILQKDGYAKVLKHIWFCFNPIWGYPCGHCAPCVSYEKEGMRLPWIGKFLYSYMESSKKKHKDKILRLNYDYNIVEISDMFVANANDPETGVVKKVFRLNETGVIIIEALQDGATIDEVARRLTEGFDVDYDTARKEAETFISKLNFKKMPSL